jgi:cytochrome c biogenesis protein CcmG, thiol:disulfide interchange protein DsbE
MTRQPTKVRLSPLSDTRPAATDQASAQEGASSTSDGRRGTRPTSADGRGAGRRRPVAPFAAAIVGIAMLALVMVLLGAKSGNDETEFAGAGKPAPVLEGISLLDNREFSLGAKRGRWMVVNFFAPTCPPCREEHPALLDFWNRHKGVGDAGLVSVLWGPFGAGPETANEFFNELGGDWPVINDPEGRIGVEFGVRKLPETYLVDPNGVLVAKFPGEVGMGALDELIAKFEGAG